MKENVIKENINWISELSMEIQVNHQQLAKLATEESTLHKSDKVYSVAA